MKSRKPGKLEFIVSSDELNPTLKLTITRNTCELAIKKKDTDDFKEIEEIDPSNMVYYPKQPKSAYLHIRQVNDPSKKIIYDPTVYWISIDRSNKRFRYGQHLTNASLTYLEAHFKDANEESKNWMNKLSSTEVLQEGRVNNLSPHLLHTIIEYFYSKFHQVM